MIVKTIPIHTDHTQVELITYFQEKLTGNGGRTGNGRSC